MRIAACLGVRSFRVRQLAAAFTSQFAGWQGVYTVW
jgi:hypothetical protein